MVEDEAYNLRLLQGMIQKLRPAWEVVATFESVRDTVEWLRHHVHPDVLLLDIQLADGLCFGIFDQIEVQSMMIFTTAYDNYAIQAFKVNSVDYLLKPFRESELEQAFQKFERLRGLVLPGLTDYVEVVEAIRKGEKKFRRRFLVSRGDAYIRLEVEDIACFSSENRITTAITFRGEHHNLDFSLDTLEEQLDPDVFYRANRQWVVNIRAVIRIENHFGGRLKIHLQPHYEGDIMVSRLKSMDFKRWAGR